MTAPSATAAATATATQTAQPTITATDTAPITQPASGDAAVTPSAPAPEAAPVTPPPQDAASKAFAAIAKKERALIEREKAHKAEVARLEAELAPLRKAAEAIKAGNALDGLGALGIDYGTLTKAVLGKPKADPVEPIKAELEAIKAQLTERQQAELAAQRAHAEREVRAGIAAHVQSAADKFPVLSATPDGIDAVFALIEQHAQETAAQGSPELLDFDEAAQAVESQLRAGLETFAPVFRRLFASGEQAPAAVAETPPDPQQPTPTATAARPTTLSNQAASERTNQHASTPPRSLAEAERERIRRAEQRLARKE